MLGAEETAPSRPHVDSAQPEVQEKQLCILQLRRKIHIKITAEISQSNGHPHHFTMRIEPGHKSGGAGIHPFLKGWPLGFQMHQHRPGRRQCQWVPDKCSRKKSHAHLGSRIVTILPVSTIQRIHVFAFSSHHPDRQAAANDFPIGRDIRLNSEPSGRTARMNAESIDNFVKNQGDPPLLRDAPKVMQKLSRLQFWAATLHCFHQDTGDLRGVSPDDFERFRIVIIQHQNILSHRLGNPRCDGNGVEFIALQHRSHQHLVHDAVVSSRKHHQLVAPGNRPRHPDRRHDRFATRITKANAIQFRKLQEQFRHLANQWRSGTNFHAAVQLRLHRLHYKRWTMSQKAHPESQSNIKKLISIDIPNSTALRTIHDQWIDSLLPKVVKSGHRPWVGKMVAVLGGEILGLSGFLHIRRDEILQMLALPVRERTILCSLQGAERTEWNLPIRIHMLRHRFDTIPPLCLDDPGSEFSNCAFDQLQPLCNRTRDCGVGEAARRDSRLWTKGPRR